MGQVILREEHLIDIANAIRTQNQNTGAVYTPLQMAPAILNLFINNIPAKRLQSIKIINQPVYQFIVGEKFSLEGLQVQATYDDGTVADVTNNIVSNIQVGTKLQTESDINIILSYSEDGITKSTSYTAYVTDITIVEWSGGTNQQIADMIAAADADRINLRKYWNVGDIRIPFRDPITPSDPSEYPQIDKLPGRALILADYGDNYELVTPIGSRTHGSFLVQYYYIWDTAMPADIIAGSFDPSSPNNEFVDGEGDVYLYNGTYIDTNLDRYCKGLHPGDHSTSSDAIGDYNFIEDQLDFIKQNVKIVQVPVLSKYNSSKIDYIPRKYFLPTEVEVIGEPIHSHPLEETVTKQWAVYKTMPEFKIKSGIGWQGITDGVKEYWTRSPLIFTGNQIGGNANGWYICAIDIDGTPTAFDIRNSYHAGLAPAFII